MSVTFNIDGWAGWLPGVSTKMEWLSWAEQGLVGQSEAPDVSQVPAMLRRRLTPLGRAAFSVMDPLFDRFGVMPIVYVSRHGEVARTLTLLQSFVRGEPASPTAFSLSVHNAIAGLFSIQKKSRASITAIAAGADDVVPALLEALGQLSEMNPRALCVFCDGPVPEFYQTNILPSSIYAAAFVVSIGGDFQLQQSTNGVEQAFPQAIELIRFLNRDQQLNVNCGSWLIEQTC